MRLQRFEWCFETTKVVKVFCSGTLTGALRLQSCEGFLQWCSEWHSEIRKIWRAFEGLCFRDVDISLAGALWFWMWWGPAHMVEVCRRDVWMFLGPLFWSCNLILNVGPPQKFSQETRLLVETITATEETLVVHGLHLVVCPLLNTYDALVLSMQTNNEYVDIFPSRIYLVTDVFLFVPTSIAPLKSS